MRLFDDEEEERACDEAGHREPRYAAIVTRHALVGRHSHNGEEFEASEEMKIRV